jgi:calcineurin B family protein 1
MMMNHSCNHYSFAWYEFSFDFVSVTKNQIERLWSRFTSLDKQQKGYLTREDFLRIPELAINPLGDRIVHAFFRDSKNDNPNRIADLTNGNINLENGSNEGPGELEVVNFRDFVRVLAHFRPLKKKPEQNKMNGREDKLRCRFHNLFKDIVRA